MHQLYNLIVPVSVELYHELVILEQTAAVGHCKQSDLQFLSFQVQLSLHIHTHC